MKTKILLLFLTSISFATQAQNDTLVCVNHGNPYVGNNANETGYSINRVIQEYNGGCGTLTSQVIVAIIDTADCRPLSNNVDYGQLNKLSTCRTRPENYFLFSLDSAMLVKSFSYLLDSIIPNGYYVLVYTWSVYPYSHLDSSFANSLKGLGSVMVNTLPDSVPFIFFCQKGKPLTVLETQGATPTSLITLTAPLNCFYTGIKEDIGKENLKVYPNPLTISSTLQFNTQLNNAEAIIYNILGKEMLQKSFSGNEVQIEKGKMESGVYFVRVRAGEKEWVEKLIVE